MKEISIDELNILMNKQKGLCVSIFMPTFRAGAESQQNQIRLRNLLRGAEEKLISCGLRQQEAKALLEPVQGLIGNVMFWRKQSDGLAIFLSSDVFRYYLLPEDFDELIVVANRFHIEPLLPLLSSDYRFYLLTLSQNEVRLFEGTNRGLIEVTSDAIPKNINEALQYDEPEKQIRFHKGASRGSDRSSMISGHGAELDDTKENLLKYFRMIDKGLREVLRDEQAPLILAGVEYQFPIYKEANTYPYLVDEGIAGNPKGLSMDQLHRQARAIIGPHFQKAENDAIAQYKRSQGTGLTSKDIKEIIEGAYHGRVKALFIAKGYQQWGSFNLDYGDLKLHDKMEVGSEGLPGLAAVQTFLNGGTVFILPLEKMPDETQMAAVFRY